MDASFDPDGSFSLQLEDSSSQPATPEISSNPCLLSPISTPPHDISIASPNVTWPYGAGGHSPDTTVAYGSPLPYLECMSPISSIHDKGQHFEGSEHGPVKIEPEDSFSRGENPEQDSNPMQSEMSRQAIQKADELDLKCSENFSEMNLSMSDQDNHSGLSSAAVISCPDSVNHGIVQVADIDFPYAEQDGIKYIPVRLTEKWILSHFPCDYVKALKDVPPLICFKLHEDNINQINKVTMEALQGYKFTDMDPFVIYDHFLVFLRIIQQAYPEVRIPRVDQSDDEVFVWTGGWLSVKESVIPYVMATKRPDSFWQLLPLRVLQYAASLLMNTPVVTLLASERQVEILNKLCEDSGINFIFGPKTAMVSIETLAFHHPEIQISEIITEDNNIREAISRKFEAEEEGSEDLTDQQYTAVPTQVTQNTSPSPQGNQNDDNAFEPPVINGCVVHKTSSSSMMDSSSVVSTNQSSVWHKPCPRSSETITRKPSPSSSETIANRAQERASNPIERSFGSGFMDHRPTLPSSHAHFPVQPHYVWRSNCSHYHPPNYIPQAHVIPPAPPVTWAYGGRPPYCPPVTNSAGHYPQYNNAHITSPYPQRQAYHPYAHPHYRHNMTSSLPPVPSRVPWQPQIPYHAPTPQMQMDGNMARAHLKQFLQIPRNHDNHRDSTERRSSSSNSQDQISSLTHLRSDQRSRTENQTENRSSSGRDSVTAVRDQGIIPVSSPRERYANSMPSSASAYNILKQYQQDGTDAYDQFHQVASSLIDEIYSESSRDVITASSSNENELPKRETDINMNYQSSASHQPSNKKSSVSSKPVKSQLVSFRGKQVLGITRQNKKTSSLLIPIELIRRNFFPQANHYDILQYVGQHLLTTLFTMRKDEETEVLMHINCSSGALLCNKMMGFMELEACFARLNQRFGMASVRDQISAVTAELAELDACINILSGESHHQRLMENTELCS